MNKRMYIILVIVSCVSGIYGIIFALNNQNFHYNEIITFVLYCFLVFYLFVIIGLLILSLMQYIKRKKYK